MYELIGPQFVLGNNLPLKYARLVSQNSTMVSVCLIIFSLEPTESDLAGLLWRLSMWKQWPTSQHWLAHVVALRSCRGQLETVTKGKRQCEGKRASPCPMPLAYPESEAKQVPGMSLHANWKTERYIHTSVEETRLLFWVDMKLHEVTWSYMTL